MTDPITILDVMALINRRVARAGKNFSGSKSQPEGNIGSEKGELESRTSGVIAPPTENNLNSGPVKSELGVNLSPDHPKDAKPVRGSGGDVPPVQDQFCRQVAVPPDPWPERVMDKQWRASTAKGQSSDTSLDSCGLSANSILAAASDGLEIVAQEFGWIEEEE